MVGIHCPLEIRRVTLVAVCIHELIISVGVARLTRDRGVRASQRELRCAMVKCRRLPSSGGMTRFTPMIKQSCGMIGICCFVEIGLVTREAGARQASELIVRMAIAAQNRSMGSGQGEFGIIVRERGRPPPCRRMAVLACCGKSGETMIGIHT